MSQFFVIFISVFLAELGDKTQLATLLFAADAKISVWKVFAAAAAALIISTAIAVLAGTLAKTYLQHIPLKLIAGICFIIIGCWTIYDFYKA